MLPESKVPPLKNLGELREFARERGVEVLRVYVAAWEDEDGEEHEAFWQLLLTKEERRRDGKTHVFQMTMTDSSVSHGWPEQWAFEIQLLEIGWQRYLEEAGVA
jgi:hypothetical protein